MPQVKGLRSPYLLTERLVYVGRMFDKIRLHAAGQLPGEYHALLGRGMDGRVLRFLGLKYADVVARVLAGGRDREILAWAYEKGVGRPSDNDCQLWNSFMIKRGWRDESSHLLAGAAAKAGLTDVGVESFFDLFELDEGRDPEKTRPWMTLPAKVVLLMGVAGSGKSTIGDRLSARLGWRFDDADDFHPPANIAKMSAGQPLNDDDRAPWLASIAEHITTMLKSGLSGIVSCSALKQAYRDVVVSMPEQIQLVCLSGPAEVLRERLESRPGHFMSAAMLDSQLAALEAPADALMCDIRDEPDTIVSQICTAIGAPR